MRENDRRERGDGDERDGRDDCGVKRRGRDDGGWDIRGRDNDEEREREGPKGRREEELERERKRKKREIEEKGGEKQAPWRPRRRGEPSVVIPKILCRNISYEVYM